MNKLVEAALEWAADGVPVFPCALTKQPMTENGFYDASTDPKVVKQMFELAGECLIGARMGAESGLFAIDVDLYKEGAAGEAAQRYLAGLIEQGVLPDTQRHSTMSGGKHIIYQSSYAWPNCKPSAGVEVKGEGGYIILPPSRGYSIEDDAGFREAPKALIDMLLSARREHTAKDIETHIKAITAGQDFHDSITSIAAKMYRRGKSTAEIYGRIQAALEGSVASNPSHPRHDRWAGLVSDEGGEISRILNSGRDKYDHRAKTDRAKDRVDEEAAERIRKAADAAGFAPSPDNHSDGENASNDKDAPTADDYAGTWPFAGEGYFAHEALDVSDQRFNLYPLYAEQESVVIAADPKAGKTAISLKLAVQVASGRSLGPFKVTDPRGVLYYALEGTRAIKLRLEAEKRKCADEGAPLPDDLPLFVVERPSNLIRAQDEQVAKIVAADRYMQETSGIGLGLVVIDTLTKAMPGSDQNSVDDTSALFDLVSKIRGEGVKATVVFVHHTGKDGKTRGSSNIEAEVDVVLKMKKQEDGSTVMFVHMARSIDDHNMYSFELTSYDLGETSQGIRQAAPVVTLSEGSVAHDTASEDAVRAHKIAPFLKAIITLGGGKHSVKVLFQHFRDLNLMQGRARRKTVTDMLDLIFDREAEVTYQGHIISKEEDGVKVAAPY